MDKTKLKIAQLGHEALLDGKYYEQILGYTFPVRISKGNAITVNKGSVIEQKMDLYLGIDYVITVKHPTLESLRFTIQERFRDISYKEYQDLTIRLKNETGRLLELYRICANYMVYGYMDGCKIDQFIVIDVALLKHMILKGLIIPKYKENTGYKNGNDSSFITIPFEDLRKTGCVIFEYNRDNKINDKIKNSHMNAHKTGPFDGYM